MSSDHGRNVASMFGRIAGWYDFLNHFLSLGLDILWRKALVGHLKLPEGRASRLLDLAAGTMDVSLEASGKRPACRVTAADFCLPMLQKGVEKLAKRGNRSIDAVQADGRALPFADNSFHAASIAFGIRNIRPRQEAYAELLRVLKPGGRLCILEFGSGKQRIMGGLYNFYLNVLLPAVGKVFSKDDSAYRYLADTILAFPDADSLAGELREAGFAQVYYEKHTFGIVVIHVGVKGS